MYQDIFSIALYSPCEDMNAPRILWEPQPEGDWECIYDAFTGTVGLNPDRSGWFALVTGPNTRYISHRFYSSAREAKAKVKQELTALSEASKLNATDICITRRIV